MRIYACDYADPPFNGGGYDYQEIIRIKKENASMVEAKEEMIRENRFNETQKLLKKIFYGVKSATANFHFNDLNNFEFLEIELKYKDKRVRVIHNHKYTNDDMVYIEDTLSKTHSKHPIYGIGQNFITDLNKVIDFLEIEDY